jgi:hypothetical protein
LIAIAVVNGRNATVCTRMPGSANCRYCVDELAIAPPKT